MAVEGDTVRPPPRCQDLVPLEGALQAPALAAAAAQAVHSRAMMRMCQRVTKGAGSRSAGLVMAFRLLLLAQASWRRLDGRELLPLVRAGVTFKDGIRVERNEVREDKVTKVKSRKKGTQDQPGKVAA